jgi:hypothetical protein
MVHRRRSGVGCEVRPVVMGKFRFASIWFGSAVEQSGTDFFARYKREALIRVCSPSLRLSC